MFSALACGHGDNHPANNDDVIRRRGVNTAYADQEWQEEQMDGEFLDKLLTEGIRLKKKCKTLKTLIGDLEDARENEKIEYEYKLQTSAKKLEISMSDLTSSHYLELAALTDSKKQEIEALHKSVQEKNAEMSLRDADFVELKNRNLFLEEDLELKTREYLENLRALEDQNEREKKVYLMQRLEHEDGVRITLLRRALLAEDEVARLKSAVSDSNGKFDKNEEICGHDHSNNGKLIELQGDIENLNAIIKQKEETISEMTIAISNPSLYCPNATRSKDRRRFDEVSSNSPLRDCNMCQALAIKLQQTENILEASKQELFAKQEQISRIMNSKDAVVQAVNELLEENHCLKCLVNNNNAVQQTINFTRNNDNIRNDADVSPAAMLLHNKQSSASPAVTTSYAATSTSSFSPPSSYSSFQNQNY